MVLLGGTLSSLAGTTGIEGKKTTDPELFEGDYLVNFWSTAAGLPHDTVNAVLQTRDGYLWVGTAAGLARFDGLEFTRMGDESGSTGLRDAAITALLEDQEGGFWIGTQSKGVFRLLRGKLEHLTPNDGLAGNSISSLAQDTEGTVWIGTSEGLNCWKQGRLSRFVVPPISERDGIVSLHAGASGAVWITTRSGVFMLREGKASAFKSDQLPQGRNAEFIGVYEDHSGKLWAFGATFLLNVTQGQSLNSFASFSLASSRVWTICEQNNANFWIGTSGQGLFRFQDGRFEKVGTREGLEQCDVRALHADRWGNLWIGTGGDGLVRLRPRGIKIVGARAGVQSQKLSAIAPDGRGGLWIGSLDSGLWHWDGRHAEPWSGGGPLSRVTQIQTLCLDESTNLWVGTLGAGVIKVAGNRQLRLTTADGLADDIVLAMASSNDGSVWAGTQSGVLHRIRGSDIETFGAAQGLSGGAILCLLPAENGSVLIGTEQGILARCDGSRVMTLGTPEALAGRAIRCLFKDYHGRLWITSWGAGAFCRTLTGWKSLTRQHGLGSDNVVFIAESGGGLMWIGTSENLLKMRRVDVEAVLADDRETIEVVPVGVIMEGLKPAQGWPATLQGGNDTLWFASSGELLPLAGKKDQALETPPPVILERILVNRRPIPIPENGGLQLGPGTESLDFEFTAISFNAPQRVRFRHRLEGFDPEWVESGAARLAHYGPLPPGEYRFRVIASNAEGYWNEEGASLRLVITPPLWRTWWFLTLAGAAITAGIWAAARMISTRRLEARLRAAEQQHIMERERARIARDMHDEIGSKLTRISFLSEVARRSEDESTAASPQVEAIADTSRDLLQSLDEIVWAVNPRNDNLEQLAGYLEQHAREYFQGTSCDCRISVPVELPEVSLSAELRHNVFLAFEEALNNSLKHAGANKVTVTMTLEPDVFEICVEDDGCGFDPSQPSRPENNGLGNMKLRLVSMGGSCQISSLPGAGTRVILRFPLSGRSRRNNRFLIANENHESHGLHR